MLRLVASSQSEELLHTLFQPGAKGFTGEENRTGTHQLLKSVAHSSKAPHALVGMQTYIYMVKPALTRIVRLGTQFE